MAKRKVIVLSIIGLLLIGIAVFLLPKGEFGSSDAENFYNESGEVVSKIEANSSVNTQTESEAIKGMHARGFKQYPVTYDSQMGGDFEDDQEALDASQEKHPSYKTYYKTDDNTLWTITAINGYFNAYPVDEDWHKDGIETMISENERIWCYDRIHILQLFQAVTL